MVDFGVVGVGADFACELLRPATTNPAITNAVTLRARAPRRGGTRNETDALVPISIPFCANVGSKLHSHAARVEQPSHEVSPSTQTDRLQEAYNSGHDRLPPTHDEPWECSMTGLDPDGYSVEIAQGRRGQHGGIWNK